MADDRVSERIELAFTNLTDTIAKVGKVIERFALQVRAARDAELALREFIAHGGDMRMIREVEEHYGVTHELAE